MTKVSTVYRVGSLHLSEGVIFNFYPEKNSPFTTVSWSGDEKGQPTHCRCMAQARSQFPSLEDRLLTLEKHKRETRYIIVFYGISRVLRQEKGKVEAFLFRKHLKFLQVLFARSSLPKTCSQAREEGALQSEQQPRKSKSGVLFGNSNYPGDGEYRDSPNRLDPLKINN